MHRADRIAWLICAAFALGLSLTGCEAARIGDEGAFSETWLAALPAAQRDEMLRPVTPVAWPAEAAPQAAGLDLSVELPLGRLFVVGDEGDLPVKVRLAARGRSPGAVREARMSYRVLGFYGRAVAAADLGRIAIPFGGDAGRWVTLDDLRESGAYLVVARLAWDGGETSARQSFAIVPPPGDVPPAESRFVATSPDAAKIGCKVLYAHNLITGGRGVTNWLQRSPERQWEPRFDPSAIQAQVRVCEEAGLEVIGHLGPGPDARRTRGGDGGLSPLPHGLPPDAREFARYTAPLIAALPTVRRWDILPEPLEGQLCMSPETPGELSLSPQELHDYLATMTAAIRSRRPGAQLWVSGGPRAVNDLLTAPPLKTTVDGVRFTYAEGASPFAAWVAGQAKMSRWIGCQIPLIVRRGPGPQDRTWRDARNIVSILAAGGDVELRPDITDDPAPAAVVAHLAARLDGTACRGEVWPELPQVRSPVFDGRGRRAAVLWSTVTEDGTSDGPYCRGLLEIPDAGHLRAEDCLGRRIEHWRGRALVVPIGEAPIFILSDRLSAADLVKRLRASRMVGLTPVAVRAGCITSPIGPRATVPVDLVGLTVNEAEVTVSIEGPKGWTIDDPLQIVRLAPGEAKRLEFKFGSAAANAENAYPFVIRAAADGWSAERIVVARQAVAPRMTVAIDGRLDDWAGAPAMTIPVPQSAAAEGGAEVATNVAAGPPAVRVRAAHDDAFFYVAAEVPLKAPLERDRTIEPTGTGRGNPWGFGSVQLALGDPDDPEVNYVLALVPTATRPAVVLMHSPGMDLRNPLPGLPMEGWGEAPGARVAIADGEGRAVYEAAIPRSALAELPWKRGGTWQFGFLVDVGHPGGPLAWAAAAGGFHWRRSRRTFFPIGRLCRAVATELGLAGPPATPAK